MVDGRVGREEQRLAWHLVRQKLKVVRQAPCGPYRIDVGIWPVAVEIHSNRSAPERFPKLMLRAQYLIEHGWSVLYLWLSPNSRFTTGPWGAPAHIAHYRRQVLAGTARPFRMSYYDGSPDDEGEVVDGRLVLGFAPELPQRWNYPLIYEQWCQLTTEEQASVDRGEFQLSRSGVGIEPCPPERPPSPWKGRPGGGRRR